MIKDPGTKNPGIFFSKDPGPKKSRDFQNWELPGPKNSGTKKFIKSPDLHIPNWDWGFMRNGKNIKGRICLCENSTLLAYSTVPNISTVPIKSIVSHFSRNLIILQENITPNELYMEDFCQKRMIWIWAKMLFNL